MNKDLRQPDELERFAGIVAVAATIGYVIVIVRMLLGYR